MSGEDQELLARIGQLAGQINLHKSQQSGAQQSGPSHPATRSRGNSHRQASAPYPTRGARGYRGGRPPPTTIHRNRSLHLNALTPSSNTTGSAAASTDLQSANPTWVSKNDRHRQLINSNIYEKQTKTRAKAMAATWQRKLKSQKQQEKKRFSDYLQQQASASSSHPSVGVPSRPREIEVNGVRFQVMDGGKKLVKATDDRNSLHMTPKMVTIAGIKFHRTKTGNLVAARFLPINRPLHLIKKLDEPCKIFSTTGSCPNGPGCRYLHDPDKVAMCKKWLSGKCAHGDSCDLAHEFSPEIVPNCLHYARGNCTNPDCLYTHSPAGLKAPVCRAFGLYGYCKRGAACTERHVFECPDFSNTGVCTARGCRLPHRERASVLRSQMQKRDGAADVSSDEEMADSDDVDSDDVDDFIAADSDESDIEDGQDFIAL